jgi:hypothetical protein
VLVLTGRLNVRPAVAIDIFQSPRVDWPDTELPGTQSLLKQLARIFEWDRAGCGSRNIRRLLAAVAGSRQVSMEIAFTVYGDADNLSAGVDGTSIEKEHRGAGGDERVEVYRHPVMPPEECAWIEFRVERYAGDISPIVDAEGDTGDVVLDCPKILDARFPAPQEAMKRSVRRARKGQPPGRGY